MGVSGDPMRRVAKEGARADIGKLGGTQYYGGLTLV